MSVFERSSPTSPFWFIQAIYRGHKIRQSSKVLMGTSAAEKKISFKKAEAVEAKLKADVDALLDRSFTKGTFGEAMTDYFVQRLLRSRPVVEAKKRGEDVEKIAVVRNFHSAERRLFGAFPPSTPLDTISDVQISSWAHRLLDSGKKVAVEGAGAGAKSTLRGEGLEATSVNAYLRVLGSVLGLAHENKKLQVVPTIKKIATIKSDPKALDDVEIEKVYSAAYGIHPRYERVLKFFFNTGCRKTEAFTMSWPQIDLMANDVCTITFKGQTKRGKTRQVPIVDGLRSMLMEMKAEQVKAGYKGDKVFAFQHTNDIWFEPKSMNGIVPQIQEASGISDWTLHVCRHTYAAKLLGAGAQLTDIKDLLGHEDIKTTQIYACFVRPERLASLVMQHLSAGWASDGAPRPSAGR